MGDESTAGESQMSVATSEVGSEMSTADGAGGGGGAGDGKRLMVLIAVCIVVTLGISGAIVYSGILDYELEEDENANATGRPAGGNGTNLSGAKPDLLRRNISSSTTFKHGHTKMPEIKTRPSIVVNPPTETPPTQTPAMEKRDGMLVCVLGRFIKHKEMVTSDFCDYVIFPDLSIDGGNVVSTHGTTSWKLFKKFISEPNLTPKPGASFITAHLGSQGSPVSSSSLTPAILKGLTDPPLQMRALGFLGIEFPSVKVAPLKHYFQVFRTALSNLDKAMTFISIVIRNEAHGKYFADEIDSFSDLDTIILETHITSIPADVVPKTCTAHYMSYKVGNSVFGVPTFKIANKTVAHLRAKTWKFRVMFSSSIGVMAFVGDKPIARYGQPCHKSFLMDLTVLCSMNGTNLSLDNTEAAAYIIWQSGTRHYFVSAIVWATTEALMADYVVDRSEGWAVFNIELDDRRGCPINQGMPHLSAFSGLARSRKPTG